MRFEIGEDSLPHLVRDHHFKMSKKDRLSSYMDMSEEQHRTALEEAFLAKRGHGVSDVDRRHKERL